jgi:hypothetical protein
MATICYPWLRERERVSMKANKTASGDLKYIMEIRALYFPAKFPGRES